jgi:HEAT repeat protein
MNPRPLILTFAGMLLATLPLACKSRTDNADQPDKPAAVQQPVDQVPATTVEPTTKPSTSPGSVTPPSVEPAPSATPPPAWLADLASADAAVRQQATEQLNQQESPTSLLLEHLTASEPTVRRGAAFGLLSQFEARNSEQTAAMQTALEDDDEMVRRVALQAVSQWSQADPVAAEAAVPTLEAIVKNSSRDTSERSQAVRILGRLGSVAQPALVQTFANDADANVRKAALAAAMRNNPEAQSIAPALIKVLGEDTNASLRRQAAMHLKAYAATAEVQPALAAAFTDSDSEVRREAATSLAEGGAAALEFTIGLLDDRNPQVRLYAVFALGNMGRLAEPAVPKLRQLTSDSDANVAKTATGVIRVIQASVP